MVYLAAHTTMCGAKLVFNESRVAAEIPGPIRKIQFEWRVTPRIRPVQPPDHAAANDDEDVQSASVYLAWLAPLQPPPQGGTMGSTPARHRPRNPDSSLVDVAAVVVLLLYFGLLVAASLMEHTAFSTWGAAGQNLQAREVEYD